MLKDLLTSAPRTEPLIRIYPAYLTLNSAAAELLGLGEVASVAIQQDDRDGYVYVASCEDMRQAYRMRRRNNVYILSYAPLCRKLAECLEGYGSYRICREVTTDFMGKKFYNIFKKKYGKD